MDAPELNRRDGNDQAVPNREGVASKPTSLLYGSNTPKANAQESLSLQRMRLLTIRAGVRQVLQKAKDRNRLPTRGQQISPRQQDNDI
jgi:hypothetical protein